MPIQAPQWTEFLICPICKYSFNRNSRPPISLGCSHTICQQCLTRGQLNQCPFDQVVIATKLENLPINYALLQLVTSSTSCTGGTVTGPTTTSTITTTTAHNDNHHHHHHHQQQQISNNINNNNNILNINNNNQKKPQHEIAAEIVPPSVRKLAAEDYECYQASKECIEELALYLKPPLIASNAGSSLLSRQLQRKLVALINCQLIEEDGRSRALRAARLLGERTVTELILQHQNPQQLSANLWAAVRARGCQFLGPAMQEEVLKLVLLALEDGSALSRKVLVMFVVQRLEPHYAQASKTSIGHVVQLLYRASCFKVSKRDGDSSLMQLKDEFRTYEALRREHDTQIVQIATEAGLRIAPDQWSSLLYGDTVHKSHMQSINDKLQTPESFSMSVQELVLALQRTSDPANLSMLQPYFKYLADIDPSAESNVSLPWKQVAQALAAVKETVVAFVQFVQHHGNKKLQEIGHVNTTSKYKVSMCRTLTQRGSCQRGTKCSFAHSEMELVQGKSRHLTNTTITTTTVGGVMAGGGVGVGTTTGCLSMPGPGSRTQSGQLQQQQPQLSHGGPPSGPHLMAPSAKDDYYLNAVDQFGTNSNSHSQNSNNINISSKSNYMSSVETSPMRYANNNNNNINNNLNNNNNINNINNNSANLNVMNQMHSSNSLMIPSPFNNNNNNNDLMLPIPGPPHHMPPLSQQQQQQQHSHSPHHVPSTTVPPMYGSPNLHPYGHHGHHSSQYGGGVGANNGGVPSNQLSPLGKFGFDTSKYNPTIRGSPGGPLPPGGQPPSAARPSSQSYPNSHPSPIPPAVAAKGFNLNYHHQAISGSDLLTTPINMINMPLSAGNSNKSPTSAAAAMGFGHGRQGDDFIHPPIPPPMPGQQGGGGNGGGGQNPGYYYPRKPHLMHQHQQQPQLSGQMQPQSPIGGPHLTTAAGSSIAGGHNINSNKSPVHQHQQMAAAAIVGKGGGGGHNHSHNKAVVGMSNNYPHLMGNVNNSSNVNNNNSANNPMHLNEILSPKQTNNNNIINKSSEMAFFVKDDLSVAYWNSSSAGQNASGSNSAVNPIINHNLKQQQQHQLPQQAMDAIQQHQQGRGHAVAQTYAGDQAAAATAASTANARRIFDRSDSILAGEDTPYDVTTTTNKYGPISRKSSNAAVGSGGNGGGGGIGVGNMQDLRQQAWLNNHTMLSAAGGATTGFGTIVGGGKKLSPSKEVVVAAQAVAAAELSASDLVGAASVGSQLAQLSLSTDPLTSNCGGLWSNQAAVAVDDNGGAALSSFWTRSSSAVLKGEKLGVGKASVGDFQDDEKEIMHEMHEKGEKLTTELVDDDYSGAWK